MNTRPLITALFVSSALIFTACTPRDVKVADSEVMGKIRFPKGKSGNNQTANPKENQFSLGTFSLASFLGEKQVEALELVKIATGSVDDKRTGFNREEKGSKGNTTTVVVSSTFEKLQYTSVDEWTLKTSKSFSFEYAKDQEVASLVATKASEADLAVFADRVGVKRFFVNVKEASYNLSLTTLADDTLELVMKSAFQIIGAKGGSNVTIPASLEVKMILDKASLETADVKVISSKSKINYPGSNNRSFSIDLIGTDYVVNMNNYCTSIDGTLSAQAGPNNKFNVVFGKETIDVEGRNWNKPLAECGSRPTVDIGRLQVY